MEPQEEKANEKANLDGMFKMVAAENRAEKLVSEYQQVFDSIILNLGLTQDSAVAPVKASPFYASLLDGKQIDSEGLYTQFSVPVVILKRLTPIVEQLRVMIDGLRASSLPAESSVLYKHKVIQFMRCYAIVARFCPKFYLSAFFEWLIAQVVELAALFATVSEGGELTADSCPQLIRACEWVRENVVFLLCFTRGTHFQNLLASDYEQGLKGVVDPSLNDAAVTPDAIFEGIDGLKTQIVRLEQQVEMYRKSADTLPGVDENNGFYKSTEEMVMDTTWNTVNALCTSIKRVPELDTVVAPLYRVFEKNGREMDLVHWAIDQDISEGVKDANLLFRTASTATRLLRTVFFGYEGVEYLKSVIYPPLKKLGKMKVAVELDPFRLPFDVEESERDDLLKASCKTLLGIAGDIMSNAIKSVDHVPIQIRRFLLYARNTFMGAQHANGLVDEQGATKLVVASLYFLRFLSPAIVTPHAYGVFDDAPNPEFQRALILLGKVLQNTACGVEFDGTKESYMTCCNSFVTANTGQMVKLFNALIDAQGIGVRELKIRDKVNKAKKGASKRENARFLQDEFEERVFHLRDSALLVNEFGMKASFLPMFRSGGGSDDAVRTIRSLIKLDSKIHESRAASRAEDILGNALKNQSSPYAAILYSVVADFADYLPNDLVVFNDTDFTGTTNAATMNSYSDTASNVGNLTHPLILLDTITAHRPSRLAAIARMLRASCQEVWEAGIALRDLSVNAAASRAHQEIRDQESPVEAKEDLGEDEFIGSSSQDSFEESDSDTQSVAAAHQGSSGKAAGRKIIATLRTRVRSPSVGSSGPPPTITVNNSDSKNSLAGLVGNQLRPKTVSSSSPFGSPFNSPTIRKRIQKFKKKTGSGSDETHLWASALVMPQVLGLLHFLTVLRHTLKHARLENRSIIETADTDSVLANCVFEYSKLAKQAGSQLLSLAVSDPTNPEVGLLGLTIANAGVLLTRSALELMNIDRQVLRRSDKKEKAKADDSSGGAGSGGGSKKKVKAPKTPKRNRKKAVLQKSRRSSDVKDADNFLPLPSANPLSTECSPRPGFYSNSDEDL